MENKLSCTYNLDRLEALGYIQTLRHTMDLCEERPRSAIMCGKNIFIVTSNHLYLGLPAADRKPASGFAVLTIW